MLSPSLVLLLGLAAGVSAAPQSASAPPKAVYKYQLKRDHLVTRSTHKTFNPQAVQHDLERIQNRAKKVKTQYTNHLLASKSNSQLKSAVKDPFDVATLRKRSTLLNKRQSGSISLTDDVIYEQDNAYYGTCGFGTPSQNLTIDFDTGSADLWVPGPEAVTTTGNSGSGDGGIPIGDSGNSPTATEVHTPFATASSSTYQGSRISWAIQYGSGEAEGFLARDKVECGGLTVAQQVFAVTNSTARVFQQVPFDGLMGMAYSTIAESQRPTFFENLVSSNALASNVFSFTLGRGSLSQQAQDNPNGEVEVPDSGSLLIGGVDSSDYTGTIAYEPVTVKGYWETEMGGISIGGQVVSGTAISVAWDTGTSLAYVPSAVAAAVAQALGAQLFQQLSSSAGGEVYVLPCSQFSSGLNVAISFGGSTFSWADGDLNGGEVTSSGTYCSLNIIGSDTQDPVGNNIAIIGDSFLKNVVSVYDYENSRVGFAAASGTIGGTASSADSSGNSSAALPSFSMSGYSFLVTALMTFFLIRR